MTLQVTMSWEEDDCIVCGKHDAAVLLWPNDTDHDYKKVCSDQCYQWFGEAQVS